MTNPCSGVCYVSEHNTEKTLALSIYVATTRLRYESVFLINVSPLYGSCVVPYPANP